MTDVVIADGPTRVVVQLSETRVVVTGDSSRVVSLDQNPMRVVRELPPLIVRIPEGIQGPVGSVGATGATGAAGPQGVPGPANLIVAEGPPVSVPVGALYVELSAGVVNEFWTT